MSPRLALPRPLLAALGGCVDLTPMTRGDGAAPGASARWRSAPRASIPPTPRWSTSGMVVDDGNQVMVLGPQHRNPVARRRP